MQAVKGFNIQHLQHYGLDKELLLQCNKREVLHGSNMQKTMLPVGMHLASKSYL